MYDIYTYTQQVVSFQENIHFLYKRGGDKNPTIRRTCTFKTGVCAMLLRRGWICDRVKLNSFACVKFKTRSYLSKILPFGLIYGFNRHQAHSDIEEIYSHQYCVKRVYWSIMRRSKRLAIDEREKKNLR